jgi:hypothetical protein
MKAGWAVAAALLWQVLLPGLATPATAAPAVPDGDTGIVIEPGRVEPGARDVTLRFRLTGVDPAAPATRFQLFLPTGRPLVGVTAPAVPGWAAQLTTTVLPAPAPSADGPVREIVSDVAWTATAPPGADAVEFALHVGLIPEGAGPVRFRAVLSDASGGSTAWADSWADGGPKPAHGALELALGAPPPAPATVAAHGHHHGSGDAALPSVGSATPGAIATTVGGLLVFAAAFGALVAVLAGRQRRRFEAVRGRNGQDTSPVA